MAIMQRFPISIISVTHNLVGLGAKRARLCDCHFEIDLVFKNV